METQAFFDRTLQDLARKTESNDPYELLMIAGLVRKLLLDAHPLMDQVNREKRLKVRFCVAKKDDDESQGRAPIIAFYPDCIDGSLFPVAARDYVTKDQFLRYAFLVLRGQTYTVHDLVDYAAHVAGAVHRGDPNTTAERALADIDQHLFLRGFSTSASQLRHIGRTVVRALGPLASGDGH